MVTPNHFALKLPLTTWTAVFSPRLEGWGVGDLQTRSDWLRGRYTVVSVVCAIVGVVCSVGVSIVFLWRVGGVVGGVSHRGWDVRTEILVRSACWWGDGGDRTTREGFARGRSKITTGEREIV